MRILCVLLASALLLVGCSEATDDGPGPIAQDPTSSISPAADTPTGATSVPTDVPTSGAPLPSDDPLGEGASAGGEGERIREDRGWQLQEVTADGRHIALAIGYGGCDRYFGPEVTETDDEVWITTVFTIPAGDGEIACTGELNIASAVVALDAPLGERTLTGCGHADCLALSDPQDLGRWLQPPAITGTTVVTTVPDGVVGLDRATGEELWRIAHEAEGFHGYLEQPTSVGEDGVAVHTQTPDRIHVLNAGNGSTRWTGVGRVHYAHELAEQIGEETVFLTPDFATIEAREPLTGDLRWDSLPDQQIARLLLIDQGVLVLSGTQLSGEGPGDTTLTMHDVTDGSVLWEVAIPGALQDVIGRDGLAVIEVEGAVYGIDLADGSRRWHILPFNVSGLIDLGPVIAAYPGRYGDPAVLMDPETGQRTGELPVSGLGDDRDIDLRRHARLDGDAVITVEGTITRRDVTTIPASEVDPDPAWSLSLPSRLSPSVADGDVIAVSTPLGARLLDAATGNLIWAHADTDGAGR